MENEGKENNRDKNTSLTAIVAYFTPKKTNNFAFAKYIIKKLSYLQMVSMHYYK